MPSGRVRGSDRGCTQVLGGDQRIKVAPNELAHCDVTVETVIGTERCSEDSKPSVDDPVSLVVDQTGDGREP